MEIEGIAANGCDLTLKEILTVKSDYEWGKRDLLEQLSYDGIYHLPTNKKIVGGTKKVVSKYIEFLQS